MSDSCSVSYLFNYLLNISNNFFWIPLITPDTFNTFSPFTTNKHPCSYVAWSLGTLTMALPWLRYLI